MMYAMDPHEFSFRVFSYRLDVAFAQQRRDGSFVIRHFVICHCFGVCFVGYLKSVK